MKITKYLAVNSILRKNKLNSPTVNATISSPINTFDMAIIYFIFKYLKMKCYVSLKSAAG